MHDERYTLFQLQMIEKCVYKLRMRGEVVAVGTGIRKFRRVPHADEVGNDAASEIGKRRPDIAPQVGGGGVTVQKNYRVALAGLDPGHFVPQNCGSMPGGFIHLSA